MVNERAFPSNELNDDGSYAFGHLGMSLRDYFAGQALAGFCSQSLDDGEPIMGAFDTARAAYNYADAMLSERQKGRGNG